MLRIAICDDDREQIEITRRTVQDALGKRMAEIDLFSDGMDLITSLEKSDYRPDVVFLDIQMPKCSGIEVAKRINVLAPACRIVFLTSFLGYATDVYETRHSYFVLKSELHRRIVPALMKVLEDFEKDVRVSFRSEGEFLSVDANEILYLERNLRKTNVVCLQRTYTTGTKAEELLQGVPAEQFVHCHQSYWVNLRHVKAMGAEKFSMANGEEIPISRSCRQETRTAFFASLH